MTYIVNTALGNNRGTPRIWLEGAKLSREGYAPGRTYDMTIAKAKLVITPNPRGKYVISKKTRNGKLIPVIDITRQDLAELFDGVEALRVLVTEGKIVITAHHQHAKVKDRVDRLMSRLQSNQPLRVCSLFLGGGVLDSAFHSGLERAGISSKIGVAVEIERAYLESSILNNPELWDSASIPIESPIQHVNLGRNPPQMDVVIGGIPCTGASRSGRSKNQLEFAESHEAAGAMFFHFLSFVEVINPSIVLIENVSEYANTASMAVIRSVLSSLNYELHERILDGNEFGALEARKRLCAVAITKGLGSSFDLSTVMPHVTKPSKLADVLEDVPKDSERWKPYSYLADKEVRDKAAGKGFARQLLTGDEGFCGTIGRGYAKSRSTEPYIVHPDGCGLSRLLTPAEHAAVKGIPFQLVQGLSANKAHEILGQSIVYPAFEAVAMALGRDLLATAGIDNSRYQEVLVETLDPENDGFIGGDDLGEGLALIDTHTGRVSLVAEGRQPGWPISICDDTISVRTKDGMARTLQAIKPGPEPELESNLDWRIQEHVRQHGDSIFVDLNSEQGRLLLEDLNQPCTSQDTFLAAA
ncbi:DNA cytosine methyltransferase [Halomonas sp. 86]|uniref:DNA cytosine methyltransferase n=1 Tax=unclassified Halomonas TaxID=2609666 RepID=UPI0040343744